MNAAVIDGPTAGLSGGRAPDFLAVERRGDVAVARLRGAWTLQAVLAADADMRALGEQAGGTVTLDAAGVTRLDSAGAWVIHRTAARLESRGIAVEIAGLDDGLRAILAKAAVSDPTSTVGPPPRWSLPDVLEQIGRIAVETLATARGLLGLLGMVIAALGGIVVRPRRLRGIAVVAQLEATGVTALPIVGLLCFLVGVVLAYMGALQLSRFGASVLTVNLVGVSVLREIGIMLTAIIVAARSGSAFAAQIGTMKVNQEVDALETMGLSAVDVLVCLTSAFVGRIIGYS